MIDTRTPLERLDPKKSSLFSPIRINQVTLENRVWLPAMVTWLSNEEGVVTKDVEQRYLRYAIGEVGMIVLEAMGIRDVASGPLMRIGHDRHIPGLRDLARKIHDTSPSKVIPQVIDFLKISTRNPTRYLANLVRQDPKKYAGIDNKREEELEKTLSPRQWREYNYGYRQLVEDLDIDEVKSLPGFFAQAARRAMEAEFDGVELHFAHAYTMASFLSRTNSRTDEYGGPALENRVRLALEVIDAVRREVGRDFLVGCRFLGSEDIAGGSGIEDAKYFAVQFARTGVDFLSLSRGGKFDDAKQPKIGQAVYPYTGHSGDMCMPPACYPAAYNHHLPAAIKRATVKAGFNIPVVSCGRIQTFELAETILRSGEADLIGMARQLLTDPDWPKKIRDGVGNVVYCDYMNICEALDRNHLPVRCKLWMNKPKGTMHPPLHDYGTEKTLYPVPDPRPAEEEDPPVVSVRS